MPLIKHISQNPWEDEDLSLRWNQEYQLELTDHKPLKSHQMAIGMPKISMRSWNKVAVTIIEIIIAILKKIYACLYLVGGVQRYTLVTSFNCIIPHFNSPSKSLLHSHVPITAKACISSTRSVVYYQSAGKMHAKAWWDTRAARRPWWYTPHFVRRWYTKPAAWINKKGTFGRQKFLFCWYGRQVSEAKRARCAFFAEAPEENKEPSQKAMPYAEGDYIFEPSANLFCEAKSGASPRPVT